MFYCMCNLPELTGLSGILTSPLAHSVTGHLRINRHTHTQRTHLERKQHCPLRLARYVIRSVPYSQYCEMSNTLIILYSYVYIVIASSAIVTTARWKIMSRHQIAGYVTRLNVGVPQAATRWP